MSNAQSILFRSTLAGHRGPRKTENETQRAERELHKLEDIALSVHSKTNQTLAARYIKPTQEELAKDPSLETWDGLIQYREGVFRVVKEPQSGMEIILFEFEPQHLVGQKDQDGKWKLADLDLKKPDMGANVYVVGAFKNASPRRKQIAIDEFRATIHDKFAAEYSLFAQDETHTGPNAKRTFRMANEDIAIRINEKKKKSSQWQSSIYRRLRGKASGSYEFQKIGESGTLRDFFSISREARAANGETFDKLFLNYRRNWNITALKKFRGQELLSSRRLQRNLQRLARFTSDMMERSGPLKYLVSASLGVAGAVFGLDVAVLSVEAAVALLAAGAAGGVLQTVLEDLGNEGTVQFRRMMSRQKADGKIALHKRDYTFSVVDQSPSNLRREFPKLNPELLTKLECLSTKEADLLQVEVDTSPVHQKDYVAEYLKGRLVRVFGQAHIPLNPEMLLSFLPDGTLSLAHIKNSTERVNYFTWREDMIASKRFTIDEDVRKQLDGKIIEVIRDENVSGQKINILTPEQFQERLTDTFREYSNAIYTEQARIISERGHSEGLTDNYSRKELPELLTRLFSKTSDASNGEVIADIMKNTAGDLVHEFVDPVDILPVEQQSQSGWLRALGF